MVVLPLPRGMSEADCDADGHPLFRISMPT